MADRLVKKWENQWRDYDYFYCDRNCPEYSSTWVISRPIRFHVDQDFDFWTAQSRWGSGRAENHGRFYVAIIFAFLLLACARDWSAVFDGFCDWSRQEKWWIGWSVITNVIRLIVLVVVVMKNLQTSSKSPSKRPFEQALWCDAFRKDYNFLTNAWLANIVTLFGRHGYTSKTLAFALYLARDTGSEAASDRSCRCPEGSYFARSLWTLARLKVVLMKSTACTAYPWLHFERIREVTLRNQIAQGHQLYAHAQVYWQPNDSSSKDVLIGPNGEVLSKFCPTRYLVKDPDTGHLSSLTPSTKAEVSWCLAMVCALVRRTYSEAFSYLPLSSLQTFNVELEESPRTKDGIRYCHGPRLRR
jgi:hypothetical protein